MKILLDMNISPRCCHALQQEGIDSVHWSDIGDPKAPDKELLSYAKQHRLVVLTHDLDFSAILAATRASGPSVIQVRVQDTLSADFRDVLVRSLRRFEAELVRGAIIVVDRERARVRVLPLDE